VDVKHVHERSILRQSIGKEIVYYYPFADYNAVKFFKAIVTVSGERHGME
jgi:hypothetical protein